MNKDGPAPREMLARVAFTGVICLPHMASLPEPEQTKVPRGTGRILIASFILAVLALVLLAWLADEVFEGHTQHLDLYIRLWIHQFAFRDMTVAMTVLSRLGSALFLAVATVLLFIRFLVMCWRRAAVWLVLAMAGAAVLDQTLKLAFHRMRPLPFFGTAPHSYSFPSGHALASFCFYGVLAGLLTARIRNRAAQVLLWVFAAVLIAAIGFSRIYLGVHYPTDVIAGYLAAAVWVSALIFADRMRERRRQNGR